MARPRGSDLGGLGLIIAAYLAICGRGLGYEFVWDDVQEIERSALFDGSLGDAMRATQADRIDPFLTHQPGVQLAYDSYRPLLVATYWAEIQIWGRRPGPMHAGNLALGAIAIVLAYALARRWLGPGPLALVPTAIFALHPVQIESVVYISGRGDVLAGLFALGAALLGLRASRAGRPIGWTVAACAVFALSLLSKESCLGLPFAIAAILGTTGGLTRRWWIPLALLGVAAGYVVVRSALIATTSSLALGDAALHLPGIWLQYLMVVVLPFDLSTERPWAAVFTAIGWGAVVVLVVVGGVVVVRRRGLPPSWSAIWSGGAWACALVAPTAVVIVTTHVVSDRYFYVPLFGLGVAVVEGTARVSRARPALRRPLIAGAALWGAMAVVVAWLQVPVWRDDEALDTHAIAMTPDSGAAYYRLGNVDARDGRWNDAIAHFGRAVGLGPTEFHALVNLGVSLLRTGRYTEAEAVLIRAVAASPPASFRASYNLGVARLALGKRTAGCADIQRALSINPAYEVALADYRRSCE